MKREEIYKQIDIERDKQDKLWSDRSQYTKSAPHILVLEGQMRKLQDEWYVSKRDALLERFLKIATVSIRALEEIEKDS